MSIDVASLSNQAKAVFLARLASELTVCARDTYEVGTDRVLRPELLRAYNELIHRVTGAVRDHLLDEKGYSAELILRMADEFGVRYKCPETMKWAIERALGPAVQ